MARTSASPRVDSVTAAHGRLWAPGPEVITRRLGDRLVVVCLTSNRIFELNFTGARIWELVAEGRTQDEVIAVLVQEFLVSAEVAAREVAELKTRLLDARLIEVQDAR